MIKPWPIVGSTPKGEFRIFKIRDDRKVSPRTHREHDFLVIETSNWVNVVAVTPDDHLVMVEQFRHGTNTVELEIPGGVMDAGESPVEAGQRELLEETGYEGGEAVLLGQVLANPAIMNNTCYTVLVRNCHMTQGTQFDHGEDMITRLVPVKEIPALVSAGKIGHSLVVVALYYFDLWRRGK
jgi:ADP-ribose pyrophosphatase